MTSVEKLYSQIQEIAVRCGCRADLINSSKFDSHIHIALSNNDFPMWLKVDFVEEEIALLYGVVRTAGLPGDRSDYHEIISLLWAITLRCLNIASVRLIDIPHEILPNELHSRLLLFDQPAASFLYPEDLDIVTLEKILIGSIQAACLFSQLYESLEGEPNIEKCDMEGTSELASKLRRSLRISTKDDSVSYNDRYNPNWSYWHLGDRGLTVFNFESFIQACVSRCLSSRTEKTLSTAEGSLLISGELKNAVDKKTLTKAFQLLRAVGEDRKNQLDLLKANSNYTLIPIESHLICTYKFGIIAIQSDCGYNRFISERKAVAKRHREETSFLFAGTRYIWKEKIDDERFELLILELLGKDPSVTWARKVGRSRAADGGRDILVDWYLRPAPWQRIAPEESPLTKRRVIVQCKAHSSSVSLSDVGDIPVVLDLHDSDGFLLVASTDLTPQLIDYLTRVPSQRKFWADWWTIPEIEQRLRANSEIAYRYTDLFDIINEETI
ncbi:MAG: restriction endonuclease [Microcoleaceae cyanobacterium MO_207.B10]|nr:restriction endonuclease [Microcoleaceae cyanobacterium MO_207.B10]